MKKRYIVKKKIEKILYLWERLYPYVIAGLITWMLYKISFNPLQSTLYQELIDGIVTLDSIIIGFEGALIPIVFSMKYESGLVKYVLENDKKGLLRKYISATIAYGLLDASISLVVYLNDIISFDLIKNGLVYLFIFMFLLFIVSTYRSMTCILKLLFSSEKKKKPDVKEKLSESESNSLWERKGK